jgi:hydrogenase expression/formation protein HypC
VSDGACRAEDERCITCGDVAVPLEVVALEGDGLALCRDERDRSERVEISLAGDVREGDTLLVHAGTAIAKLTSGSGSAP